MNATPKPHLGDLGNVGAADDDAMGAGATSEPTSDDGASTEALAGGIPGVRGRAGRVSFLTHMGISLTVPAIAFALALDPLHDLFETQRSIAMALAAVVTLVAVLDADKEGYLRSKTSLIQTCGRAARNADGRVILYADKRTDSIEGAIGEMERRRKKQIAHNEEQGITPKTIVKPVRELLDLSSEELDDGGGGGRGKGQKSKKGKSKKGRGKQQGQQEAGAVEQRRQFESHQDLIRHVKQLRQQMITAAKDLDFELAAQIRDEVYRLEQADMELL